MNTFLIKTTKRLTNDKMQIENSWNLRTKHCWISLRKKIDVKNDKKSTLKKSSGQKKSKCLTDKVGNLLKQKKNGIETVSKLRI